MEHEAQVFLKWIYDGHTGNWNLFTGGNKTALSVEPLADGDGWIIVLCDEEHSLVDDKVYKTCYEAMSFGREK